MTNGSSFGVSHTLPSNTTDTTTTGLEGGGNGSAEPRRRSWFGG